VITLGAPCCLVDDFLIKMPSLEEILCRRGSVIPAVIAGYPSLSTVCTRTFPSTGDDDDAAYAAANQDIIHEAEALAKATSDSTPFRLVAVIVWEASARGNRRKRRTFDLSEASWVRGAFVLTR
jgi:hypothetical protein